ncbi:hypothetical protein FZC78_13285 [Rossellomorea vietnamensis]|uniref:Flagellar hook-length control protein FliK n=1 Tax=Rossellomorea vietnamensis TaxID=218284 RepID=A0A5D4NPQ2_9BACI|nr:hypothetical protein [Rossellomorea vietnamensis]TYS16303.1 hypothetical protein FZC78_13285 [Rossellomorea vietnamensis]
MLERSIQSATFQKLNKSPYPPKLIDGQVFYAKVNKLLPEGMAEVNYKGQKTIAKLEAPLIAGNHYFFQAELADEGILKLRVISSLQSEGKGSLSDVVEKFMSDLQLPKGGNIKELVALMVRNSMPFTKGELLRMGEVLTDTPDKQEGIQTLLRLKDANLTITRPLYFSYLYGRNMESVTDLLDRLETALQNSTSLSTENKGILKILAGVKESETNHLFQKVVNYASGLAVDNAGEPSRRAPAQNLLQLMGIEPPESSLGEIKSFIGNNGTALLKDKMTVLAELLAKVEISAEKPHLLLKDVQTALDILKSSETSSQEIIKGAAEIIRRAESLLSHVETIPQLTKTGKFNLMYGIHSRKEQQALISFSRMIGSLRDNRGPEQQALRLLQEIVAFDEGNAAKVHKENLPDIIKDLISKLGLNQEARLAGGAPGDRSMQDSLKPSLIALLKELPHGEARESAERLLYKLNGQAALSGESGPLQHVVYQLPLSWMNQRTDLTMQWTGRKTESGKIDSEYCRVLFYLELESIKEVIVDMTVQNRVIALNIYNDTPGLKELSAPFSMNMKEGLELLGYKLSSVHFKESGTAAVPAKEKYRGLAGEVPYAGVDLKV